MRGSDLSNAQLQSLRISLKPKLAYLQKLRERMELKQFPQHDRLYRNTVLSEQMMKELLLEIETMLSFRNAVGVTPEPFG